MGRRRNAIRIDPQDNVAVLLEDVGVGGPIIYEGGELTAADDIPRSHKVALNAIRSGQPIVRYGEIIAFATTDIAAGAWVHTHNLRSEGL